MLIDPTGFGLLSNDALRYANQEIDLNALGIPDPSQIKDIDFIKSKSLDTDSRNDLVSVLLEQYSFLDTQKEVDKQVFNQIQSLQSPNTYTVTTGQQIHIFLGPTYVPHKIMSAVYKAKEFSKIHCNLKFVPVFWMATEDHDFEEIRTVRLWNQEFVWDADFDGGAVGNMPCKSIALMVDTMLERFRLSSEQLEILLVFKQIYSHSDTLANATRKLVHHFFGKYGVVVIDPNHPKLKAHFAPIVKKELQEGATQKGIEKQNKKLKELDLPRTIPARNTSLFVFNNPQRERLDKIDEGFLFHTSNTSVSTDELMQLPTDKFSPNVALRPLYQELILPNVAYIAGASELFYWMQLPEVFNNFRVSYPLLLLRQHGVYLNQKTLANWERQGYSLPSLLYSPDTFYSFFESALLDRPELNALIQSYDSLSKKWSDYAFKLDKQSVKKVKNEMKQLRNFLLRHFDELKGKELEQQKAQLNKLLKIRNEVFPNQVFQERIFSFLELVLNSKGALPKEFYEGEYNDSQLWLHMME